MYEKDSYGVRVGVMVGGVTLEASSDRVGKETETPPVRLRGRHRYNGTKGHQQSPQRREVRTSRAHSVLFVT